MERGAKVGSEKVGTLVKYMILGVWLSLAAIRPCSIINSVVHPSFPFHLLLFHFPFSFCYSPSRIRVRVNLRLIKGIIITLHEGRVKEEYRLDRAG